MSRSKKKNRIKNIPEFTGFKPEGRVGISNEDLDFFFEEYQALYYADYLNYPYLKAAEAMDISKSTFGRLIIQARHKVAKAFVECKGLSAQVGQIYSDNIILQCDSCRLAFIAEPEKISESCPSCGCDKVFDVMGGE